MPSASATNACARRELVLEAAQRVFLRYGFKKTSMDDLARAAGLSRQGLYRHFETKEALFKATFEYLAVQIHAATGDALARSSASLEDRLVGAFEANHGHVFTSWKSDHLDELFGTAAALIGAQYEAAQREFVALIAEALTREGVAAAWKPAGLTAKELAEHLYATSYGLKHTVAPLPPYQARMRTAVKILVRGARADRLRRVRTARLATQWQTRPHARAIATLRRRSAPRDPAQLRVSHRPGEVYTPCTRFFEPRPGEGIMRDLHVTSPMMAGAEVLEIQRQLTTAGYQIGVADGIYGPTTAAAVRSFQRDHHLVVDGVVGPQTRAALATAQSGTRGQPSPLGLAALAEAAKYVGVKELPPNSNRTPFGTWFGVDGVAWCNIFVSYCFAKGANYILANDFQGGRGAGIYTGKGCAYVPTTEAWLRATGMWLGRVQPLPGDIAIYNWDGGEADHIGIVSRYLGNGDFEAIEGNTGIGNDSNGGEVMRRVRNLVQVNGFGRIAV